MVATDGELLLRAILENPAEDTARLVYADYLDENGQGARAAFIRAQVVWARRGKCPHCERMNLRVRSFNLTAPEQWCPRCWPANKAMRQALIDNMDWSAPLWDTFAVPDGERFWGLQDAGFSHGAGSTRVFWEYERGFVAALTCTAASWLTHADELTAAHPIERVRFTTWPEWDFNEYGAALKGRDRRDRLWGGDHSQREIALRLLAGEWPRIAFELPSPFERPPGAAQHLERLRGGPRPQPDPPDEAAFLAGLDWRIEVWAEQEIDYMPSVTRANLTAETTDSVPGQLLGMFFGPVEATDRHGRRWRVERAVCDEYDADLSASVHVRNRLRARSVGAVRPARVPPGGRMLSA